MILIQKFQRAWSDCNQWLINKAVGSQLFLRRLGFSKWFSKRIANAATNLIVKVCGRSPYRKEK